MMAAVFPYFRKFWTFGQFYNREIVRKFVTINYMVFNYLLGFIHKTDLLTYFVLCFSINRVSFYQIARIITLLTTFVTACLSGAVKLAQRQRSGKKCGLRELGRNLEHPAARKQRDCSVVDYFHHFFLFFPLNYDLSRARCQRGGKFWLFAPLSQAVLCMPNIGAPRSNRSNRSKGIGGSNRQ